MASGRVSSRDAGRGLGCRPQSPPDGWAPTEAASAGAQCLSPERKGPRAGACSWTATTTTLSLNNVLFFEEEKEESSNGIWTLFSRQWGAVEGF